MALAWIIASDMSETNKIVISGVRREIRHVSEMWFECRQGRHHLCKARSQYEATDMKTDTPVLVVQQCDCSCHNRAKG